MVTPKINQNVGMSAKNITTPGGNHISGNPSVGTPTVEARILEASTNIPANTLLKRAAVPATVGSEQAGSQSSSLNDRNATVVANLAAVADNTTRNNERGSTPGPSGSWETQNPFKRTPRVARSPQKVVDRAYERTRSSPPALSTPSANTQEKAVSDILTAKIQKLVEMMALPRRSIHQPLRDLVDEIAALHQKACKERHQQETAKAKSPEPRPRQSVETQTESLVLPTPEVGSTKRARGEQRDPQSPTPAAKKRKHKTPLQGQGTAKTAEVKIHQAQPKANVSAHRKESAPREEAVVRGIADKASQKQVPTTTEKSATPHVHTVQNNKWTKVRKKRKKAKRPPRKDAIVIKTTGAASYADILRQVKAEPQLKELSQNVRGVRKTAKGELLILLEKTSDPASGKFQNAVQTVLGTNAEVKILTEVVQIEIRDIDEVTSKEEVLEALKNNFAELKLSPSNILSLRRAYGGTQTATISLVPESASKLIKAAKVRIGWVVCRIRPKISPMRCFKCMDFGHAASKCKSEEDCSKTCFRCGSLNHRAKACKNVAICMICVRHKKSATKHATTSTKCPFYQKALRETKAR